MFRMKVKDLSKELGITNGDLIQYLKSKDFKVSSHMQNLEDEMIEDATSYFSSIPKPEATETDEQEEEPVPEPVIQKKSTKTFSPDDLIPCRSVTPWKLNALGVDRKTIYHWENFGDVDYVAYRDLQALRRKDLITKPKVIIEDPDLCSQWSREIGDIYKPFLGVDYPEELFDLPDSAFEKLIRTSTDTVREVVKVTAINMVKNENYPSLQKLNMIDTIMGTCIKEFV